MREGKIWNGIMFKNMDKNILKSHTDRVYEAIKYLKSKSITERNNVIRAASVWVPETLD